MYFYATTKHTILCAIGEVEMCFWDMKHIMRWQSTFSERYMRPPLTPVGLYFRYHDDGEIQGVDGGKRNGQNLISIAYLNSWTFPGPCQFPVSWTVIYLSVLRRGMRRIRWLHHKKLIASPYDGAEPNLYDQLQNRIADEEANELGCIVLVKVFNWDWNCEKNPKYNTPCIRPDERLWESAWWVISCTW